MVISDTTPCLFATIMINRYSFITGILFLITLRTIGQTTSPYSENVKQAEQYFQSKEYLKAAKSYSCAFASNKNLGRIDHRYDAARCWSLAGVPDSSFYQLDRIIKAGYSDYLSLRVDTAFNGLHSKSGWKQLLDLSRANELKKEELTFKNLNRNLVLVLDTIYMDDQLYRRQMKEAERKHGWSSPEMAAQIKLMQQFDAINIQKVEKILKKYGWLGKEEIGNQGTEALFLVIQHADLATQDNYLPILRQAVKDGKATASDLALLEDRVAVRHGKKQVYGSQMIQNNKTGKYYVQPLEDPENVDKRRATVGLPPIAEYVHQWGIVWSVEQYKKDLTENSQ
jgi:hypothetical protein